MLYLWLVSQATEAVNEAKKLDPSSINTLFMLFKLALAGSNVEQGLCTEYLMVLALLVVRKCSCLYSLESNFFLTTAKDILQNMCSEVAKLENTDKESEAQKLICQAAFMAYEVHLLRCLYLILI